MSTPFDRVITGTIVTTDAILREGLRALLELEQDLRIVGEAPNGIDAVPDALQRELGRVPIAGGTAARLFGFDTTAPRAASNR